MGHSIEMCQREAARYVQNNYHHTSSVTNMLRSKSISVISQIHETTKSFFPTQNQNTTYTQSFRVLSGLGLIDITSEVPVFEPQKS